MPYHTVADLPKAQTDQRNPHQKDASSRPSTKRTTNTAAGVVPRRRHSAAKKAGRNLTRLGAIVKRC